MKIIFAFIFSLFVAPVFAQTGHLQPWQLWGNPTSSAANPTQGSLSTYIDGGIPCSAQGSIILRGASTWGCVALSAVTSGLNVLAASTLATAAVLPNTPTYLNGTAGVGATLTSSTNTTLTVDGTSAPLNTVVLVKNQASAFQNGIYIVSQAGSGSVPWILTRVTYFDQAAEMKVNSYTFVTGGSANLNSAWVLQAAVTTVGTDPLTWAFFSSTGSAVQSLGGVNGNVALGNCLSVPANTLTLCLGIETNTLRTVTATDTVLNTDCGKILQLGTGSTGLFAETLPSISGFDGQCVISLLNGDSSRAKLLTGFPSVCFNNTINGSNGLLFPGQLETVGIVNGAWAVLRCPGRWRPTSAVTFTIDNGGSDTTGDGLSTGGATSFATINHCMSVVASYLDFSASQTQPVCGPTGGQTFTESVSWAVPPVGTNTLSITGQGSAFTWKPAGSNPTALVVANNANIQATNITFSGAGTTCGSAAVPNGCRLVTVHNMAIYETFAGITCASAGTAGTCVGTDLNTAGGGQINIDNGYTFTGVIDAAFDLNGGTRLMWNGALVASGLTMSQVFGAVGGGTNILIQGNFSTSGSFGTARPWAILNNATFCSVSGVAIPGSTPGVNSAATFANGVVVNGGVSAGGC